MIRILAVGKKHEDWVRAGIERYEKRLKKPFNTEWVLLAHSALEGLSARHNESEALLTRLDDEDYVVLLDEVGTAIDSPAVADLLETNLDRSRRIVIIIGGAYGVDEMVRKRANFVWSLSPLVFPHQLVRLILIEQLYRGQEIATGRPYHHV